MWYLIWILGTFFACALSIISAMVLERVEEGKLNKE